METQDRMLRCLCILEQAGEIEKQMADELRVAINKGNERAYDYICAVLFKMSNRKRVQA